MPALPALRDPVPRSPFRKGDVLVLFGELFQRGYANGLVDEAERCGMTVVRATVGRRDRDGQLRPLNTEEAAAIPTPFINVPLEAGFDLEPDSAGLTPVEQLKDVKLSDWVSTRLNWNAIEDSRRRGIERFRQQTHEFLKQLEPHIPAGANVLFAHLMAGGVPRAKIVMPLMNRAFKGTGDRYIPSETFWTSDIGRLCELNFHEVTAETFRHLVELSAPLREHWQKSGSQVSYLAYGYHGTEVLIGSGSYVWQTYTPYLQGFAKKHLEALSVGFHRQGISTCVYNCPEILTNSSSIFQGVELSLYPLLEAFQQEAPDSAVTKKLFADCAVLLKDGANAFPEVRRVTTEFLSDPLIRQFCVFEKWPQHSSQAQMERMLKLSDDLITMHNSDKSLITAVLSEAVFESCGILMLHETWKPRGPYQWIGHDVVAKTLTRR